MTIITRPGGSSRVMTMPLPAHRCTDHDCIYLGQPSADSCACHKTREQMLAEQRAELLAALHDLLTRPTDGAARVRARAAIAKAEGGVK